MEIFDAIITAVGTLGFPAVMCVLMFNYMKDNTVQLNDAVSTLTGVVNELKAMIQVLVNEHHDT